MPLTNPAPKTDKRAAFPNIADQDDFMGPRIENVGALSAFVQAAELRSFEVAGQQFGLSSSAIGKASAELEDQLVIRLLHRSTRAIRLTDEGEIVLHRCRRVLCELRDP